MRNFFLILALIFQISIFSQTCSLTVAYDYMESWTWFGGWVPPSATTGYFTNASISPSTSAVLYGSGTGTSPIEASTYSVPNLTGLNPTSTYRFKFRLGSYRFSSTNATRGVDIGDYVELQTSTDGGVTFFSEIRITGNNNANWDYNSLGIISKTANLTLTTYSPVAGGDRTLTGDGYSDIELILPNGITQFSANLFCRANASGEEWWIDNIEMIEYYGCVPLPIELIHFSVTQNADNSNLVNWTTATELNNQYFTIERSKNAQDWIQLANIPGAGTSINIIEYQYIDEFNEKIINYYRLKQTDFSGESKYSQIVAVNNSKKKKVLIKMTDLFGREIESDEGQMVVIYYYSDGSCQKVYRFTNK